MYKIGELSKLSKIPVKTLRYYDYEEILRPDYIDPLTGYRYYNAIKLSGRNKENFANLKNRQSTASIFLPI